ncbi:hypothetical protein [Burkholderia sp. BCC0405]|uniref:hypothetical protein n=1 Tax=Burkholderia sp. BCC0405 TaxID=2676298 RepID=UPI00158A12A1|nr:hypothetical protein [Burkholderia sp. BCC0405]
MADSIAHCSAHRHGANPSTGGLGLARIDADGVRSGRHGNVFHPDAQSDARCLKVPGTVP